MNKLTIPALLLGVVMIAGVFAFMPVQEASTVHLSTTTLEKQMRMVTITSSECAFVSAATDCDTLNVTVASGASFEVLSMTVKVTEGAGTTAASIDFGACTVNSVATTFNPADAAVTSGTVTIWTGDSIASVGSGANTDFACVDSGPAMNDVSDRLTVAVTLVIDADAADPSIALG